MLAADMYLNAAMLFFAAVAVSRSTVYAGLGDFLQSTAEKVSSFFSTLDDDENKIHVENVVKEGNKTLSILVKELSLWGTNALEAASKKGWSLVDARPCIDNKRIHANEFIKEKREELSNCSLASPSLASDFVQSFVKSNDASTLTLGKPESGCNEDGTNCKFETVDLSAKAQFYGAWGTHLSAVQRCVQEIIEESANGLSRIYRNFLRECLLIPRRNVEGRNFVTIVPEPPKSTAS